MRRELRSGATQGVSCLLATLILVLASPARGDESATEKARQHYETGTKQYDLGHWDESIQEFEKAYDLRPDPSFLYNLAQAYRRKGDSKRALDLYRNYLVKVPKTPQRAEIEEKIKEPAEADRRRGRGQDSPARTGADGHAAGTTVRPSPGPDACDVFTASRIRADLGDTACNDHRATANRTARPGHRNHQRSAPDRGRRYRQRGRTARARASHRGHGHWCGRCRFHRHGHGVRAKGPNSVEQGRRRRHVQSVG